jgi:hypothetical protein
VITLCTPQLSPAKTVEKSPRTGKRSNQLALYQPNDGAPTVDTTEDFQTNQHRREHDKDGGNGDDRTDFNGDGDKSLAPYALYITGQSLFGAFSRSSPPSNDQQSTIFTNGADVDLKHYLHSFVETLAEKERAEKIFTSVNYSPSDGLIVASVNMFARKKKRHFFLDGLYFCKVFAKEMDMSLSSFLKAPLILYPIPKMGSSNM